MVLYMDGRGQSLSKTSSKTPSTAGLERERYGKYTVQVHRRGISCAAETDERNQCEYDPS
jgi:hypothetical protein